MMAHHFQLDTAKYVPDSQNTSGPCSEPEDPMEQHMTEINDYFRVLAVREKSSKDKKLVRKCKRVITIRYGVAHLLPQVCNPEEMPKAIPPPLYVAPTERMEELSEVSEDIMNEDEPIVSKVASLSLGQHLRQLETQPSETNKLLPTHVQLLVERVSSPRRRHRRRRHFSLLGSRRMAAEASRDRKCLDNIKARLAGFHPTAIASPPP